MTNHLTRSRDAASAPAMPRRALAAFCLAALAGCAAGPDFKRPDAPASAAYAPHPLPPVTAAAPVPLGDAQHFDATLDVPADWWTLFRSPGINALVARAFKANPDIQAAQAALRQSRQYVLAQQGAFYPTLGANYSPSRNKVAGNNGGGSPGQQNNGENIETYATPNGQPPYNAPVYYDFHVAQLTVGYVPDVFGGVRRQVEALDAQANARRFELEATYITLASNVTAAALQEASLRAQIDAMTHIVDAERENLSIMRKRHALGDVSGSDVDTHESALAQAEQAIVPLRLQLERTRDQIRALAGNFQDEDVLETFDLEGLYLPQELPLALPSRLVGQRPDVRIAEESLHAASAAYGVAIAATLPQFSVSGALGGMAVSPGWMFRSGGGFFDLTGNVAYTIFDGGALRAQSRAAQEALAQAAAQYRGTVITALQNVADTLHAIQSDAETLAAAARSERAMNSLRGSARKQYQAGYVSRQSVLVAEQNYWQARIALAQAQAGRLSDTAALYQALGGGWWNRAAREDVPETVHSGERTKQ